MDALGVLVQGMQLNERALHYQSINLVNMQTPGYRRANVNFTAMLNQQLGDKRMQPPPVAYDKTPGGFISTGKALDVYLQPDIYMTVKEGQNSIYGRGGQLSLDAEGSLVDSQGKLVAGMRTLKGSLNQIRVQEDGTIWSGDEQVASLNLVRIQNPTLDADGYVRAPTNTDPIKKEVALISGGLEGSNTNFIDEVVSVMQQVRSMNGLQYAYKNIDGLFDKALSELGHF